MKRNCSLLVYFLFCIPFVFAETIDCEKVTTFLNKKQTQIAHLNLQDPDYIPLHFLLSKDIVTELNTFKNEVIPFFTECPTITFSELINKYDELTSCVKLKHDSLAWLSKNVHLIFYNKALFEYQLKNEEDANYFLDRSLQYNETFPDAILLKLNKLLDKNLFETCLSLLNTLYYETELDREQEKQAIIFTDKFYEKLYKTGDSLVKSEHAAEALQLFEILEIFCQNLPTSYCNDDYYHGVLRSKTGIYESYLAIAKVAEKRSNPKIAEHFYQYAKEYLEANPHLKGYEPPEEAEVKEVKEAKKVKVIEVVKVDKEVKEVKEIKEIKETKETKEVKKVSEIKEVKAVKAVAEVEEIKEVKEVVANSESVEPQLSAKEIQEKYDKLVLQALALTIKESFSESYRLFSEAKKLEDCKCIKIDFRVDLMLKELLKIIQ